MVDAAALSFVINAKDEASKVLHDIGGETEGLGGKLRSLAPALVGVAAGFLSFKTIESAVGSTTELGIAVGKLSRETGLSTEEASKMLFAFEHVGLSSADASKSLGIFSKNMTTISEAEDGGIKASKTTVELLKEMGISAFDASGHLRPMSTLLDETADKFKAMPDGIEKTGMAMQLFGRSGKDMIPLLNQGSKGLEDLGAEATKLGVVLTASNVSDIKKYVESQREMHAAVTGVKLVIGEAFIPVLTQLTERFVQGIVAIRPFIQDGIVILQEKFGELQPTIERIANEVLPALKEGFNVLATFVTATVVPMVLGLTDAVGTKLTAAWAAVGPYVDAFLAKIQPVVDELTAHSSIVTQLAVVLGGVFAVAIAAATLAMASFAVSVLLAAAPFIAVGVAVAALSAGVVLAIQHWDEIKARFPQIEAAINAVRPVLVALGATVQEQFAKFKIYYDQSVKPAMDNVRTAVEAAMVQVRTAIAAVVDWVRAHWPEILSVMRPIIDQVVLQIRTIVTQLRNVIDLVVQLINGDWAGAWRALTRIVNTEIDFIKGTLGNLATFIRNLAPLAGAAALDLGKAILNGLKAGLSAIGGFAGDVGQAVLQAVKSLVNTYVIDKINRSLEFSVNTHIPGVGTINLNPPDIPHLAQGAYVGSPTLAVIGDAPGGEWVLNRGQMAAMMGGGGGGGTVVININAPVYGVDGLKRLIQAQVVPAINTHLRRGGFYGQLGST